MSRFVASVFAASLIAIGPASACSCGPVLPQRVMATSALVFDGTVLDRHIGVDRAGVKAMVLRIAVTRMVKGERPRSGVVVLYSPWSPALCGVTYDAGHAGRFGAVLLRGGPYTSSCTQLALDPTRHRGSPAGR